MNDALGDRMKEYEVFGCTSSRLMARLPIIIRLDGKAFHSFTHDLVRPYDIRLSDLMVATTSFLVELSNAKIGYTQSDEITLILYSDDPKSQMFFDGKRDKLNSILAAYTTIHFNKTLPLYLPEKVTERIENSPVFDCRSFSVPTLDEAVNILVWREQDATRNSISMAAQSMFSHKELMGKSCDEMQEMMFQKHQVNWNNYPSFFKRGTYIKRKLVKTKFEAIEIEKLPLKHEARQNPGLLIERHIVEKLSMPTLTKVKNRTNVIFGDEGPITEG